VRESVAHFYRAVPALPLPIRVSPEIAQNLEIAGMGQSAVDYHSVPLSLSLSPSLV